MAIDTPQRRDRIVKLVQNCMPSCEVVFLEDNAEELAFRIRGTNGKYRTGATTLLGHHEHVVLNNSWLQLQIQKHGGPHIP